MALSDPAPSDASKFRVFPVLLLALGLGIPVPCQGGTYSQKKALYDNLLSSATYNPQQRPMLNQSKVLQVRAIFELVSIVEINDVLQSFRCNGFLGLFWTDELLQWNSSDYGGEWIITPKIKSVFRPQVIMLNTIEKRDLFEDDYAAQFRVFPVLLLALGLGIPVPCQGGTYSQKKALYDNLLSSATYNPQQRPMLNQSEVLQVRAIFELVSIVEINDVLQTFRCNGFLGLFWTDEMLRWNSSDYGGETVITPKITSVFRPQVIMLNTMEDRDLFEDNYSPLDVTSEGQVTWAPGSIFPASCKLDLTKYPFDQQHCEIQMLMMNYHINELQFEAVTGRVGQQFFTQNGQWDILNMSISTRIEKIETDETSLIVISFHVRRKPTFLVLSVLLPIVFLSLLQMLMMNYHINELQFEAVTGRVGQQFFTQNGQWDILNMSISTRIEKIERDETSLIVISFHVRRKPTFLVLSVLLPISFHVRRKPTFLVLSVLLPIVFLSLLNLLVFVIPVDSGEKISYGITVLLALSLFMSSIPTTGITVLLALNHSPAGSVSVYVSIPTTGITVLLALSVFMSSIPTTGITVLLALNHSPAGSVSVYVSIPTTGITVLLALSLFMFSITPTGITVLLALSVFLFSIPTTGITVLLALSVFMFSIPTTGITVLLALSVFMLSIPTTGITVLLALSVFMSSIPTTGITVLLALSVFMLSIPTTGITVLLALSVFMSIMSSMLPSSSESMPLMIGYIFILMIISVLTVVDSIIIVGLHHMEEKKEKSQKAKANLKAALPKISTLRRAVAPMPKLPSYPDDLKNQSEAGVEQTHTGDQNSAEKPPLPSQLISKWGGEEDLTFNKFKLIGKHIDQVSLAVFGVVWLSVTLGFMMAMAA
ncbi:hypothetical protein EGW08_002320 [Elysia chlorotica]|uniref:Neurotransmitter-gated ion-channel ligand-binding domain-containing protein n=1 Tax=Elysia chlorotica TaxID=188477 RepID=A0A433U7U3_ELYCH|nr:hypothetical protein EGW08_002320 [Elysia chlorotica]